MMHNSSGTERCFLALCPLKCIPPEVLRSRYTALRILDGIKAGSGRKGGESDPD